MQLSLARAPGVAFTVFSCLTGAAAVAAASLLRGSPDAGTAGCGVAVQASSYRCYWFCDHSCGDCSLAVCALSAAQAMSPLKCLFASGPRGRALVLPALQRQLEDRDTAAHASVQCHSKPDPTPLQNCNTNREAGVLQVFFGVAIIQGQATWPAGLLWKNVSPVSHSGSLSRSRQQVYSQAAPPAACVQRTTPPPGPLDIIRNPRRSDPRLPH